MNDIVIGRVADVIDLETIDLEVTQIVRDRHDVYNSKENVRMKTFQHKLQSLRGIKNKGFFEALLKGRGVMCLIIGRDAHGRIEADVYVLEE